MVPANRQHHVVGPLGEAIGLEALPPQDNRRWTVRRKAEVVAAVDGGLLTFDHACERYGLTVEELTSWQRAVRRSGAQGLRATRIQQYRDFYASDEDAKRKSEAAVKRFLAALSG